MIVGKRDGVSLVKDMGSEMLYRLQLTSMSLDKWTSRKRHHSPGHERRYWWCQDDVRHTGIVSIWIRKKRDQVGGPVASKLDCHRDKNLHFWVISITASFDEHWPAVISGQQPRRRRRRKRQSRRRRSLNKKSAKRQNTDMKNVDITDMKNMEHSRSKMTNFSNWISGVYIIWLRLNQKIKKGFGGNVSVPLFKSEAIYINYKL